MNIPSTLIVLCLVGLCLVVVRGWLKRIVAGLDELARAVRWRPEVPPPERPAPPEPLRHLRTETGGLVELPGVSCQAGSIVPWSYRFTHAQRLVGLEIVVMSGDAAHFAVGSIEINRMRMPFGYRPDPVPVGHFSASHPAFPRCDEIVVGTDALMVQIVAMGAGHLLLSPILAPLKRDGALLGSCG